jgi:O-acetyl-ADP-ribose deacetylase (regulator of RNase III)
MRSERANKEMMTYIEGDLFRSPAKVLVNPINTAGVMGKGLALEFKRRYPAMFREYQTLCEKKQLEIGQLWIYKTAENWVLNFPTKKHWRQKSEVEYIEAGLERFVAIFQEENIDSIAFPQLGCGSGQLDWETQVRPLMERYLGSLPITIHIHIIS